MSNSLFSALNGGGVQQGGKRNLAPQCRARYEVSFGANIAVPAGGTAGPISATAPDFSAVISHK